VIKVSKSESTKEFNKFKEVKETGTKSEDALAAENSNEGFIDLIEKSVEYFEMSTNSINRISGATETIGQNIKKCAEEYAQSQNPTPNMKQAKWILKRAARDMKQFVKDIEPEIPIFCSNFSTGTNALAHAEAILNDSQGENQDQIYNALDSVRKLKNDIIPTGVSINQMKDAVHKLPRASRDLNIAKNQMERILDKLIDKIDPAKDLVLETEKKLENDWLISKSR